MALKSKVEEQAADAAAMTTAPAALATDIAAASVNAAVSASRATADTAGVAIDRVATSARNGLDQAATQVEQTQARLQQGLEKAMRTAEEIVAFGQGNIAALVRSGQIWAAGMQDLGKQVAATAQGQIADTVTAFKAIAGAKSMKDALEMQAALARTTIEKTVAEFGSDDRDVAEADRAGAGAGHGAHEPRR